MGNQHLPGTIMNLMTLLPSSQAKHVQDKASSLVGLLPHAQTEG